MNSSHLTVRRRPDEEEPYTTELEIVASNGVFAGSIDFYCRVSDLAQIGRVLQAFPRFVGDEYKYERGSDDPANRLYSSDGHFVLRAHTVGSWGKCALQISMDQSQSKPEAGACLFSMPVEPASINRLGNLFVAFSKLQHLEFKWIPNSDAEELYEQHQRT